MAGCTCYGRAELIKPLFCSANSCSHVVNLQDKENKGGKEGRKKSKKARKEERDEGRTMGEGRKEKIKTHDDFQIKSNRYTVRKMDWIGMQDALMMKIFPRFIKRMKSLIFIYY